MTSDHDPGRTEPDAERARSQPEPSQTPRGSDTAGDTTPYAALYNTLARVIITGPWWRRWLIVAVDAAQSWWQRGYAAVSETRHLRHRRVFTITAAGGAALVLSMTGVVTTVQESWTPARIGAALKFDEPAPSDEPARTPVEQPSVSPSPAAPEAGDRRVAGEADDAAEPGTTGMPVEISATRRSPSDERSKETSRPRKDRSASDSTPDATRDSAPATDSQPATDSAPAPEPAVAAAAPAPAPKPAPAPRSNLGPGSHLAPGGLLRSPNGRYVLVMQPDGNLVASRSGGQPLWSSRTHGNSGAMLVNQPDGNLVVNARGGRPLWSTRTAGRTGAVLVMQDDGNVVVYAGGGSVWASGTAQ